MVLTAARQLNLGDPEFVHLCAAFRDAGPEVAAKAEEGALTQTKWELHSVPICLCSCVQSCINVLHRHRAPSR